MTVLIGILAFVPVNELRAAGFMAVPGVTEVNQTNMDRGIHIELCIGGGSQKV